VHIISFVEPDVGGRYIPVNHLVQVDVCQRPAQLTCKPEKIAKRQAPVFGLKIAAVVTQFPACQVLEYQVLTLRFEIEVVQRHDAGVRSRSTQHHDFSLGGSPVGSWCDDSKGY